MIGIINYGLGNIKAFENAFKDLSINTRVISKNDDINKQISHIILPGVGSFDSAILKLNQSGLKESLFDYILSYEIPVLGVCVGMQIMAESSEEGQLKGLNWVPGKVLRFKPDNESPINIPHMGWNSIIFTKESPLFLGIKEPYFYFLHSYYFSPEKEDISIGETFSGKAFTSAFKYKNFYGTQFHPEKSHQNGIQLLKNFALI